MTFLRILLSAVFVFALIIPAAAKDLTVMTGPHPPFTICKGLRIQGIAVDTFTEITKMTKTPFDRKKVKLMPWKKAYAIAGALPGHVLLNVPRTPEVENKFEWVGPMFIARYILVGKKDREYDIASIADAAKYKIGAVRGKDPAKELLIQGLPASSLKLSSMYVQPLRELESGKVDLVAFSNLNVTFLMEKMRMDVSKYKMVLPYKSIAMYFAFSRKTDPVLLKQLNQALESYKRPMPDGDTPFKKNSRKYVRHGVIK